MELQNLIRTAQRLPKSERINADFNIKNILIKIQADIHKFENLIKQEDPAAPGGGKAGRPDWVPPFDTETAPESDLETKEDDMPGDPGERETKEAEEEIDDLGGDVEAAERDIENVQRAQGRDIEAAAGQLRGTLENLPTRAMSDIIDGQRARIMLATEAKRSVKRKRRNRGELQGRMKRMHTDSLSRKERELSRRINQLGKDSRDDINEYRRFDEDYREADREERIAMAAHELRVHESAEEYLRNSEGAIARDIDRDIVRRAVVDHNRIAHARDLERQEIERNSNDSLSTESVIESARRNNRQMSRTQRNLLQSDLGRYWQQPTSRKRKRPRERSL